MSSPALQAAAKAAPNRRTGAQDGVRVTEPHERGRAQSGGHDHRDKGAGDEDDAELPHHWDRGDQQRQEAGAVAAAAIAIVGSRSARRPRPPGGTYARPSRDPLFEDARLQLDHVVHANPIRMGSTPMLAIVSDAPASATPERDGRGAERHGERQQPQRGGTRCRG